MKPNKGERVYLNMKSCIPLNFKSVQRRNDYKDGEEHQRKQTWGGEMVTYAARNSIPSQLTADLLHALFVLVACTVGSFETHTLALCTSIFNAPSRKL